MTTTGSAATGGLRLVPTPGQPPAAQAAPRVTRGARVAAPSRAERAEQVARGLLAIVDRLDPDEGQRARAQLVAAGDRWIAPQHDIHAPGAVVQVVEAAKRLGVKPGTVYSWCSRPEVPVNRYPGGVLLEECRAWMTQSSRRPSSAAA